MRFASVPKWTNCMNGIEQCLCIFWNMIQDLHQQIMFFMRCQITKDLPLGPAKNIHLYAYTKRFCVKVRSCSDSTILHIHVHFWVHTIYFLEFLVTCYIHSFLLPSIKMLLGRSVREKNSWGWYLWKRNKKVLKFPAHKNVKCMVELISLEHTLWEFGRG